MSQHDYDIANNPGLAFRADLNQALQAIVTLNSGAAAPANTFPGMLWLDTSTVPPVIRQRNQADDDWIAPSIAELQPALDTINTALAARVQKTADTGSAALPSGTQAQRDEVPSAGYVRFNTTTGAFEGHNGTAWGELGGAGLPEGVLVKTDSTTPCLTKTGADTLSIKAGTIIYIAAGSIEFPALTAVTMPLLTAGEDYSVWAHPDGSASAVADPWSSPATAPVAGAIKIGGFHYGLVAPGTTPASGSFSTSGVTSGGGSFGWTQTDVDRIAGINEYSLWDRAFRCKGEQRGMAFDPLTMSWHGIYFMSDSPHIDGPSRYNTNVASGTVLPFIPPEWGGNGTLKYSRLSGFEAHELVSAYNLRLPTFDEFMSYAFGVTEGQSLGGASSTIPATLRQPGYTSRIGIEQATGHHYVIGAPIHSLNGSAWTAVGRGSWYGTTGLALFGGYRPYAALSGSRCASFHHALSSSNWYNGVRAAGDHLNLVGAAR
jgi:hypothetical protein